MYKSLRTRLAPTTSSANIHRSAVVSPQASIAEDVEIGPFVVVESDVVIESGCRLEARVVVKSGTSLGPNNHLFEGAVIGGMPQHVHAPEQPGKVVIGGGNTLRENVTVHRALEEGEATMGGALVMHDKIRFRHTCLAQGHHLGGHALQANAYMSGAAAAHQFCRIGTLAMVGGQSHIVKDVPPFVTVDGLSSLVVGLNQIGLRRAGCSTADIRRLKEAYRVIYRSRLGWNDILTRLHDEFNDGLAASFYEFLSTTTRGITCERRLPPGATIKLRTESEPVEQPILRFRAG